MTPQQLADDAGSLAAMIAREVENDLGEQAHHARGAAIQFLHPELIEQAGTAAHQAALRAATTALETSDDLAAAEQAARKAAQQAVTATLEAGYADKQRILDAGRA